jgi:hypothetical protein
MSLGCARGLGGWRSNLHKQERIGTVQRLEPLVACCARPRCTLHAFSLRNLAFLLL